MPKLHFVFFSTAHHPLTSQKITSFPLSLTYSKINIFPRPHSLLTGVCPPSCLPCLPTPPIIHDYVVLPYSPEHGLLPTSVSLSHTHTRIQLPSSTNQSKAFFPTTVYDLVPHSTEQPSHQSNHHHLPQQVQHNLLPTLTLPPCSL